MSVRVCVWHQVQVREDCERLLCVLELVYSSWVVCVFDSSSGLYVRLCVRVWTGGSTKIAVCMLVA